MIAHPAAVNAYNLGRAVFDAMKQAKAMAKERGGQLTEEEFIRVVNTMDNERPDRPAFSLAPCEPHKPAETDFGDRKKIPPTPEQVTAYSASIGYPMDGQAWCDAYEQKGWMVGRAKMKDWQAAVRNWKTNGYSGLKGQAPAARPQAASLTALQFQIKEVKEEIHSITHPGGAAYPTKPTGAKLLRYEALLAQRDELKRRIDSFSQ